MESTPLTVKVYSAGETVINPLPGDFFLIHEVKFTSKCIQYAQRLRFTKEEAYWNHCGVFTGQDGAIIEALAHGGVTQGNISKYQSAEYIAVSVKALDSDRQQMLQYAQWAIGKDYSFLTDLNIGLWCIFGGMFDVSVDGHMICSGLVACTLERAGYIFERDPSRTSPADLATKFQVHRILGST